MPQLGQIATGAELGRSRKRVRFIWHGCPNCGKERWVELVKGKPEYDLCLNCSNKIKSTGRKKEKNNNWRGGGQHYKNGYVRIYRPEHPRSDREGYIKRAIVILEEKLGRPLLPGMDSHHKNEIKDDDRPENLEEREHSEHASLHQNKNGKLVVA